MSCPSKITCSSPCSGSSSTPSSCKPSRQTSTGCSPSCKTSSRQTTANCKAAPQSQPCVFQSATHHHPPCLFLLTLQPTNPPSLTVTFFPSPQRLLPIHAAFVLRCRVSLPSLQRPRNMPTGCVEFFLLSQPATHPTSHTTNQPHIQPSKHPKAHLYHFPSLLSPSSPCCSLSL